MQNVGAHLARDARQRRGDETEGGARLHHGTRTSGADSQAVHRRQVARKVRFQTKLLQRMQKPQVSKMQASDQNRKLTKKNRSTTDLATALDRTAVHAL